MIREQCQVKKFDEIGLNFWNEKVLSFLQVPNLIFLQNFSLKTINFIL